MSGSIECGKCGRSMEPGFLLEHGHMDTKKPVVWIEGDPERSFWTGLSTSGKASLAVQAFRCPDCGRLEFYANKPAGA